MLIDLLTHVSQESVIHYLLTTSSSPEIIQPVLDAGIEWFQPTRRWHYDINALSQMAVWLRQKEIDVVHTYNAFANSWGYIAAKMARIPVIFTGEHGSILSAQPPINWTDKWAQRRATAVIANSKASKMLLREKYHIPADRIYIVHNAVPEMKLVDIKKVRDEISLGRPYVIGSVGRLDMPKDFGVLVEAAANICAHREDVTFVLVGGGPQETKLRRLVQERGLTDRFIMTGWRADARSLIQAFDILISTSLQESFGNTLIEAALAGKPVIAPAVGGIPDVVEDGKTGVLLIPTEPVRDLNAGDSQTLYKEVVINGKLSPPRSLNSIKLAEVIDDMLNQPGLLRSYGQAGKIRAHKLFLINRYIKDVETIYARFGGLR
ncbi:MAG: glycosyltransferase [Chloroflexi bacterium]|nr:glycosyltransferase [Chloroflexota bacterium]